MTVFAELIGAFSLVPVELSPVRAVRVMATDAGETAAFSERVPSPCQGMTFISPFRSDPPNRVGGVLNLLMAGLTKIIPFFLHEIVVGCRMDTVAEETLTICNRFVDVSARKIAFSVTGKTEIRNVPDKELREVTLVRIVAGEAHPRLERAVFS